MNTYNIIEALHILSVISWMAGMLYLPRLFVYHADVPVGSERDKMLQVMEEKLLRYIINPAMIATFVFGIWLITMMGMEVFKVSGWLHAKITLVLLMAGVHGMLSAKRKQFIKGANKHSAKFYRWLNEAPTVLMIGIVFLVVVKPF